MTRPIQAEVDLAALRHNLACVRARATGATVLAVVKANAYGHGVQRVSPAFEAADGFALLELDAAVALRERYPNRPILLLEGFFDPAELPEIGARGIAVAVHDVEQVRILESSRLTHPIDVYLKLNTGMNRLGVPTASVATLAERLDRCDQVGTVRLMTHFARADEPEGIVDQLAAFNDACAGLPFERSLANSAGIVRYGEVGGDIVRPGIMLYGATPFADVSAEALGLKPAMTLHSRLIAVQELAAGDRVGYGASYTAERAHRIGVIACGYADGYPRHAPTGTPILVCGKRTHLVGRVSMDMITVDLSEVPEAQAGSPVVLWGAGLPIDEVAACAGTIGYELMCAVAPRVPFVVTDLPEPPGGIRPGP